MAALLKEEFSRPFVRALGQALKATTPAFDRDAFARACLRGWTERELKDRMHRIADQLAVFLPGNYLQQLRKLRAVHDQFTGLAHLVFSDFVERHGLSHPDPSLDALLEFTRLSSAEFAVRAFIARDPEGMLKRMQAWTTHESEHVRRLASEGSRARLPWATRVPVLLEDPAAVVPILEALKDDPSEYVRRSVANNLNDICKDHPELALKLAGRWSRGASEERRRLIKHGLRTLLKAGDPRALAIVGVGPPVGVKLTELRVRPRSVLVGQSIKLSFLISADGEGSRLRLEYAIGFRTARGQESRKVFQIWEGEFSERKRNFKKAHSFRPITTRRYYTGRHALYIIVNGKEMGSTNFMLKPAE